MDKIKIKAIVVKENIRKDYGDLTELTASIKEKGVRQPLELDETNELIDGDRRLKAAKAAGLDEVPYFYSEIGINKIEEQLISGIFQKNLNPIEEGKAFRKYLDEVKVEVVTLASRISKSESYIEKRLALIVLPDDAKKALISKKIQLGHALILAKMPKNEAINFMKEIARQDYSVAATRSALEYHERSKTLSEAKFNKIDCKDCKHNGSVQCELFETGKTLTGKCLNPGCFNKKTAEKVKQIKEEFKDVLFKPVVTKTDYGERATTSPDGFVNGEDYDCQSKGVTDAYKKKLRKERSPENYIVSVEDDGDIVEFFKPPKKKGQPTDEKQKAVTRSDKLKEKISYYQREQRLNSSVDLLKVGLDLKGLVLWHLIEEFDAGGIYQDTKRTKTLFESDGDVLDKETKVLAMFIFNEMDNDCLKVAVESLGFQWKKQFEMTEEYLKLYTKDQMIKLAKELKIDVKDCTKNKEFRDAIIKGWKKGQVPKVLGDK